jgi:hypothetical protein
MRKRTIAAALEICAFEQQIQTASGRRQANFGLTSVDDLRLNAWGG